MSFPFPIMPFEQPLTFINPVQEMNNVICREAKFPLGKLSFEIDLSYQNTAMARVKFYEEVTNGDNNSGTFSQLSQSFGVNHGATLQIELEIGTQTNNKIRLMEEAPLLMQRDESTLLLFQATLQTEMPQGLKSQWWNAEAVEGNLLSLTLKAGGIPHDKLTGMLSVNRRLLENLASADTAIKSQSGVEIWCHKSFLSVHSEKFKKTLQTKKAGKRVVKISELDEDGVQALLDYLYCWELKTPQERFPIAVALLMAANKYLIAKLEDDLLKLIVSQEMNWFTAPDVMVLLNFVKKKTSGANGMNYKLVKEKAEAVLSLTHG